MMEIFSTAGQFIKSGAGGWALAAVIISGFFGLIIRLANNRGELDVSKVNADVLLNQQANETIARLADRYREQVEWYQQRNKELQEELRLCAKEVQESLNREFRRDADARKHALYSERIHEHLVAIVTAPPGPPQQEEVSRAKSFLLKTGKLENGR